MKESPSYQAGVEAAKRGTNINNSYPWNHDLFVMGHNSISNQNENLTLKRIAMEICPEEYSSLKIK